MSEALVSQAWFEQCCPPVTPGWWQHFRRQQLQEFKLRGVPTRKEEAWKYTDLTALTQLDLTMANTKPCVLPEQLFSSIRIVFVNGKYHAPLSTLELLPKGVIFYSLLEAVEKAENLIKPYLLKEFEAKKFPFATLNSAGLTDGIFLQIPKNIVVPSPIHLIFINTQQQQVVTQPRNIIVMEEFSQATLIEEYLAIDAQEYVTNHVTDVQLAAHAQLNYYKIQAEDVTATHLATVLFTQQKESQLQAYFFTSGSLLAREDVSVHQLAQGAASQLTGFYSLLQVEQHADHHVEVEHAAAYGTSKMLYKGILAKNSSAVFNGKVLVQPGVTQICAQQENHNLLLSSEAEINTKPELEIYAEDVKCTHGATIGQLDTTALFYLRSRGLSLEEAQQILRQAFAMEIMHEIKQPLLRDYIQQRMCHVAE